MTDIAHARGEDIQFSATGDLLVCAGPQKSRERILRRLLTNPGDYIWHPRYGAGLPRRVGAPADAATLAPIVRRQMAQERGVSQDAPPVVRVTADDLGAVFVQIQYLDAETGEPSMIEAV